MRVPDLDWPADLFTDTALADDREAIDPTISLWPAMRNTWTRVTAATEWPCRALGPRALAVVRA